MWSFRGGAHANAVPAEQLLGNAVLLTQTAAATSATRIQAPASSGCGSVVVRSPSPVPPLRRGPQQHLAVASRVLGEDVVVGSVQGFEAGAQALDR
jgi:hypothetical protein